MSSFCSLVCLLILLGVSLVFGGPVLFVSENLAHTHDTIADMLGLKEPAIGSRPLFSSVITSINTSCQRKEQVQLVNATLDVYAHIFSSILQHHHPRHHDNTGTPALLDQLPESSRSQVETALTELQQKMATLKTHLNRPHHQSPSHEDVLSELSKIKVDDPLDQRKALAQFKEVYQAASVIASHGCGAPR